MATILVIDDDPQICDLLQQVLGKEGHAVHTALNGIEGISLYRQHHPELILLDILMPEKEGLETILDLRREFPNVMTIAMSGGSERAKINLLELAQRLGAQYQLTKPFQLQTVIELVNTALGRKGNVVSSEGSGEPIGSEKNDS
ncbi:MAG: response regulator [Nitrospirota bacterium]|nr:response regulator [Nitrospirota bacterium]MDX2419697.1 response regulator [Nitrospirota bacterium]